MARRAYLYFKTVKVYSIQHIVINRGGIEFVVADEERGIRKLSVALSEGLKICTLISHNKVVYIP